MIFSELANRMCMPFMNLILAIVCTAILLKTSLLRRRASFAPAVAVLAMAVLMTLFMTSANMISSWRDFYMFAGGILAVLVVSGVILYKK